MSEVTENKVRYWILFAIAILGIVLAILSFLGIGYFSNPWVSLIVIFLAVICFWSFVSAKLIERFYQLRPRPGLHPDQLGISISSPLNNSTVATDWFEVMGKANSRLNPHNFRILHKTPQGYYFQHKIEDWSEARKEWSAKVRIGNVPHQEYTIEIAYIPDRLFAVVEYFDDIGKRHNGKQYEAVPVETMKNTPGFFTLDEMKVKYVPSTLPPSNPGHKTPLP